MLIDCVTDLLPPEFNLRGAPKIHCNTIRGTTRKAEEPHQCCDLDHGVFVGVLVGVAVKVGVIVHVGCGVFAEFQSTLTPFT